MQHTLSTYKSCSSEVWRPNIHRQSSLLVVRKRWSVLWSGFSINSPGLYSAWFSFSWILYWLAVPSHLHNHKSKYTKTHDNFVNLPCLHNIAPFKLQLTRHFDFMRCFTLGQVKYRAATSPLIQVKGEYGIFLWPLNWLKFFLHDACFQCISMGHPYYSMMLKGPASRRLSRIIPHP